MKRSAASVVTAVCCVILSWQAVQAEASEGNSSSPLPTDLSSAKLSGSVAATSAQPYAALQEAWDSCFAIKGICSDLLDEGRYAPARKNWVDYDASSIAQALASMKTAVAGNQFEDTLAVPIAALEAGLSKLHDASSAVKAPTDDKYPPTFWAPTRDISAAANDLDKSLVQILGSLDDGAGGGSKEKRLTGKVSIVGKSADVEGLLQASKKIDDAIQHFSVELDRMNNGIGPAPTQPLKNEFYGGAFTKQEIMNQYKYMPNFVFTTDPNVARFSYRLPPRKNMLALYALQIGKLLNLMDGEMQKLQTAIQASGSQAQAAPWQAMEAKYIDARKQYLTIYNLLHDTTDEKLAQDIRNDQLIYGKPVIAIRTDMDQFKSAMDDLIAIGK